VQALAYGQGKVLDIPEDIAAKLQSKSMAPWGSQSLIVGDKETQLQYEVQVGMKFSMAEEDGAKAVSVGLEVNFTGWLTGHESAKFQADGKPLPAPAR